MRRLLFSLLCLALACGVRPDVRTPAEPIDAEADVATTPRPSDGTSWERDLAATTSEEDAPSEMGRDAAVPDSARDAGAAAGGPNGCGTRSLMICDGFEGAGIDGRIWKTTGVANLRVESTRSFRGNRSLFVRGVNQRDGGGKIYLDGLSTAPFRDGFFGRAYVYFASRTPRTHADLVFASGPANGGTVVWRYGVEAHNFAGNWWGAGGEGAFPSDRFFTNRDAVPIGRWFCMEWQFDGRNNEMRFWLDGAARPSLWRLRDARAGWPAPPFQRIEIGFQIFGQDPGGDFSLWFDEIALDRDRIGCGV